MPSLAPAQFVLIPCEVSEGMFSDERAVKIEVEGKSISLFANRGLIVEVGGHTYLKVTFAGENGKPQNKTILLPSESFETGSRWVSVPERLLRAA